MSKLFSFLLPLIMSVFVISACSPPDPDRKAAFLNTRIGPEGYITKTHLYVSWPAEFRDEEEIAKPLKLKIPLEYLSHDLLWTGDLLSIDHPVSFHDGKITTIYLRMMPEAQPIVPEKYYPSSTDTPEMEKVKAAYFHKSYSVHISRNATKVPENTRSTENTIQVSNVAGLERYVQLTCYDLTELKNRGGVDYQRALSELSGKAKDDLSPANCISDRNHLFLQSPQGTSFEKAISVSCIVLLCKVDFRLKNRTGSMVVAEENPQAMFTDKIQAMKPPQPYKQPMLDEIWTDLPRWQQRVDPTMQLLNSFVIDDSQWPVKSK